MLHRVGNLRLRVYLDGVSHQFFNTGDTPVKLFWMYSPSGAERDVIDADFS